MNEPIAPMTSASGEVLKVHEGRLRSRDGWWDESSQRYYRVPDADERIASLTQKLAEAERENSAYRARLVTAENQATSLTSRLREMEGRAQWQPIETAPKSYTPVMLFDPMGVVGEGWYSSHLCIWEFANSQHVMRRDPTHWQPLPAPPAPTSQSRDGG